MQLCLRCHRPCESNNGFCQQCHSSLLARVNHQESSSQPVPLLPLGSYPRSEIQPAADSPGNSAYWSVEAAQQSSSAPQLKLIESPDKQSSDFHEIARRSATLNNASTGFRLSKSRSYIYILFCAFCILALFTLVFTQFHFPAIQARSTTGSPQQNTKSGGAPQSSQSGSSSLSSSSSHPFASSTSPTTQAAILTPGSTPPTTYITPSSSPTSTSNTTASPTPISATISNQPATPVSSGSVTIVPTSFSEVATQGQGNPAATNVTITNTENRDITWQASSSSGWLSLSNSSGTIATGQHASITVSYSSAGLAPGSYHAQISITVHDATNTSMQLASQTIQVTLAITTPCVLQISPTSLTFSAVLLQKNVQGQNITLTESGSCNYPITWQASVNASSTSWLILATHAGTDTGTGSVLTVTVKTQNSVLGNYQGQITFSAIDSSNINVQSTTGVSVKYTVLASL